MWALRFDGVNDIVTIASGMTGNAGTSLYTMRIRSGPAGITLPASGLAGFIGTSSVTTSNGLIVNSTGQLRVYTAGTNRYGSTAQLVFSGVQFDYTLTHLANGNWNIFNNITGAATGESGVFTGNNAFSSLNQFGRSSSNNAVHLQGDIEVIAVTGLTNARTWDAGLSGGTGSILPTSTGTNQGSLVNFPTDNSQWIPVATSVSLTFSGALPKLTASIGVNVTSATDSVSFAGVMPKLTATASIAVTNSYSVTVAGTMPKLTASASVTVITSADAVSFTGTLPKLQAAASVFVTPQAQNVTVSGTMPRLRMSAQILIAIPLPTGDPLAIKQALVNARRAAENRNDEYTPPAVVIPEWYIVQQAALAAKQRN